MLYYTDSVGIAAATVGTILLLSRLLDGVSDLAMRTIIDLTHTRWGKAGGAGSPRDNRRVLWMAVPMGFALVLTFSVPGSLSMTGKVIYADITYTVLAAGIYTACNLPYDTLLCLITDDPQARVTMTSIRFIGVMSLGIVLSATCMPLVSKFGWTGTTVIYGCLAIALLLVTFFGTHERVNTSTAAAKSDEPKMSIRHSLVLLSKNKYFFLLVAVFVCVYMSYSIVGGVTVYDARDVLGNANLMEMLGLFNMAPRLPVMAVYPAIVKRIGKWKSIMIGLVLQVIGFLIMAFEPGTLAVAAVGLILTSVGGTPSTVGLFAMVPDIVDYGEWNTGVRLDGLTNSITSFGMKVGTGLGSAALGWGLAAAAYDGKLTAQTPETVHGIKMLFTFLPLVFVVITGAALWFCNLDKI